MKKKFPGAQEGLERGSHVFGQLTTFREAYPQVIALELEVFAAPMGFGPSETYWYSLSSPPGQYAPCPNPQCSGGGFNMGLFLGDLIRRRATEGETKGGCVGAEKMGRSSSRHCHFGFTAKAKLQYADAPEGPESEEPV